MECGTALLLVGGSVKVSMQAAIVCYEMAEALREQVKLARHNKKQCALLMQRVDALVAIIQDLKLRNFDGQPAIYMTPLNRFKAVLVNIQHYIQSCAKKKFLHRLIKANSISEKYTDLNIELEGVLADLNLNIQADCIFSREQDEQAIQEDMSDLKTGLVEIKQEQGAIFKEALSGLANQEDRDALYIKQMAAMQHSFEHLLDISPSVQEETHLIEADWVVPFDDLTFEKRIAKGGFGNIYLGRWCETPVVIKEIQDIKNAATLAEFQREVQIMIQLRHQNVVQLFGACSDESRACIIMEYLPEGSLTNYLAKHPDLSLLERHKIILSIALGLSYMHSQGVYHRDLKSENILITANGHAKLADLGLAKSKAAHVKTSEERSQAVEYFPPEFITQKTYTARSEVFCLGVLFAEVLTGKKPFSSKELSATEIMTLIVAGEREEMTADFPQPYGTLIKRCCSHSPAMRPGIAEIIGMLRGLSAQEIETIDGRKHQGDTALAEKFYNQALRYEFVNALQRAAEYYERSIQYGHVAAHTNLGLLLLQGGQGIDKDPQRANRLWQDAARLGHLRAAKNLVQQYKKGDGLDADPLQAAYWRQQLERMSRVTEAQSGTSSQHGFFKKPIAETSVAPSRRVSSSRRKKL